jgi:hypothetical protein
LLVGNSLGADASLRIAGRRPIVQAPSFHEQSTSESEALDTQIQPAKQESGLQKLLKNITT